MKLKHLVIAGLLIMSGAMIYGASPEILKISKCPKVKSGGRDYIAFPSQGDVVTKKTEGYTQGISKAISREEGSDFVIIPPYVSDFLKESQYYGVVDANGDGTTWTLSADSVMIVYNYSYNTANDWLLSPPIYLEGGKIYEASFDCKSESPYDEQILDIKLANGKDAGHKDMSISVLADWKIGNREQKSTILKVDDTGYYRLGFHVTTPVNWSSLYFYGFEIKAPKLGNVPGAPKSVKITPDSEGALKAEIAIELPELTLDSAVLESPIQAVKVHNISSNITVEEAFKPETQTVVVTDKNAINGINKYQIWTSNAEGTSVVYECEGYVGIDVPKAPNNVRWDFLEDGVTAHVTWEAPDSRGVNNLPIDQSTLVYSIYGFFANSSQMIGTYWKGNDIDTKIYLKNRQGMCYFGVIPSTDQGVGEVGVSNMKLCGIPYVAPVRESFPNCISTLSSWLASKSSDANSTWTIIDNVNSTVGSDEKDGMLAFKASDMGEALVLSPLIDFSDIESPVIEFECIKDENVNLQVVISIDRGETFTEVSTVDNSADWTLRKVSLPQFKGKNNMIVGFRAKGNGTETTAKIDNIFIGDDFDNDLSVKVIPKDNISRFAGHESYVSVTIANNGKSTAKGDSWKAEVYCGEDMIGSVNGVDLLSTASTTVDIPFKPTPGHVACVPYVSIKSELDENENNNTMECPFELKPSWLPTPQNLVASVADEGVVMEWAAPAETSVIPPVFEQTIDFEAYESWSVGDLGVYRDDNGSWVQERNEGTLGDFKIIDGDQFTTYALMIGGDYPNKCAPMAYTVFDVYNPNDISQSQPVHSGQKSLCAWSSNKGETDDWLIFPRIGDSKVISFWARSMADIYGLEQFEVYVSSTGDNKSDFTLFGEKHEAPFKNDMTDEDHGFTFFEFELPENTQYVALRHVSNNRFGLLIDDISYTPYAGEAKEVIPVSYNIYRNGQFVESAKDSNLSYLDKTLNEGSFKYTVSAVYDLGESGFSNEACVNISGVEDVSADDIPVGIFKVYNFAGMLVKETADKAEAYDLPSGLYIINGRKVAIR